MRPNIPQPGTAIQTRNVSDLVAKQQLWSCPQAPTSRPRPFAAQRSTAKTMRATTSLAALLLVLGLATMVSGVQNRATLAVTVSGTAAFKMFEFFGPRSSTAQCMHYSSSCVQCKPYTCTSTHRRQLHRSQPQIFAIRVSPSELAHIL